MLRALTRMRLACAGGHAAAASHGIAIAAVMRAFEPAFSFDDFRVARAAHAVSLSHDVRRSRSRGRGRLRPACAPPGCRRTNAAWKPPAPARCWARISSWSSSSGTTAAGSIAARKRAMGWETAGGHIENGETPMDAARQLFEETARRRLRLLFDDYAVRQQATAGRTAAFTSRASSPSAPSRPSRWPKSAKWTQSLKPCASPRFCPRCTTRYAGRKLISGNSGTRRGQEQGAHGERFHKTRCFPEEFP